MKQETEISGTHAAHEDTQQMTDSTTAPDAITSRNIAIGFANSAITKKWTNTPLTIKSLLKRASRHEIGQKDGPVIMQGELIGNERAAEQVKMQHLLLVDYDGGHCTIDQIADRIRELGLFAAVWHTYSNQTTMTTATDAALRKALRGLPAEIPELEYERVMQRYLHEEKCVSSDIRVMSATRDAAGNWIAYHDPIEKVRAMFVLDQPFAVDGKNGADAWKSKYLDFCNWLGIKHDHSCSGAQSLFYLPRRSEDSDPKDFRAFTVEGKLLDLSAVPTGLPSCASVPARKAAVSKETFKPATPGLLKFIAKHGDHFDAVAFFEEAQEPRHRYDEGHCDFECPNATSHTVQHEGDRAFTVWSATPERGFGLNCLHKGCQDEHGKCDRAQLLDAECQARGIKDADELLAWCPDTGLATTGQLVWPVTLKLKSGDEKPDPNSIQNVIYFLASVVGVKVRRNVFSGEGEIEGLRHHDQLNDAALNALWAMAREAGLAASFDPFVRLVFVAADRNRYHPVRDYLDRLVWDGKPRVDTWLSTYTGADPTNLNSHFGRVFMLGAVRRVLEPGCKFDYALVLEGPQNIGKSTVAAVLGGDWYGDNLRLGSESKETIERTRGRWIVEIPELSGMKSNEVEATKAQITTQTDRSRMAYGRTTESVPRQFVMFGTTNSERYLKDRTGNRRFLPVRVSQIDINALRRDRDQLWAEAYQRAKGGESTVLPACVWADAMAAQEARVEVDAIKEQLTELLEGVTGRVRKDDLWAVLGSKNALDRSQRTMNDLTAAMRDLGWVPERQRHPDLKRRAACYSKGADQWLKWSGNEFCPWSDWEQEPE